MAVSLHWSDAGKVKRERLQAAIDMGALLLSRLDGETVSRVVLAAAGSISVSQSILQRLMLQNTADAVAVGKQTTELGQQSLEQHGVMQDAIAALHAELKTVRSMVEALAMTDGRGGAARAGRTPGYGGLGTPGDSGEWQPLQPRSLASSLEDVTDAMEVVDLVD